MVKSTTNATERQATSKNGNGKANFEKLYHTIHDDGHAAKMGAAFCVFAVLLRHADSRGKSFPGRDRIAILSGLSVRTVDRHIAKLCKLGYVTKAKHSYSSNAYRVNLTGSTLAKLATDTCQFDDPTVAKLATPTCQIVSLRRPSEEDPLEEDPTKTSRRTFRFAEKDMDIAKFMFSLIRQLNPDHREPNLEKWANEIRLMRETDNRTPDEIRELFKWANSACGPYRLL